MTMIGAWMMRQPWHRSLYEKRHEDPPQTVRVTCECGAPQEILPSALHKHCLCDRCGRTVWGKPGDPVATVEPGHFRGPNEIPR